MMNLVTFSKKGFLLSAVLICFSMMLAAPATAGGWLASLNVYRLGHNLPSGASQSNKKTQIKNFVDNYHITLLQEVMKTTEMPNVTPGGYYYRVSGLKGDTSYKEAYGFVYKTSLSYVSGNFNYPNSSNFDRDPSAVRVWFGSSYVWCVNFHAAFSATDNANEIKKLNLVYNYFKNYYSTTNDVILGGDFNRTATSSYFNNLKNAGATSITPNSKTTINSSCSLASPYDHFAWNPNLTYVTSVGVQSVNLCYWRNNVSDHRGIKCYVNY